MRVWYTIVHVRDFEHELDFFANRLQLPVRFSDEKFGHASFATEGALFSIQKIDASRPEQAALTGRHTGIGFGVPDLDKTYAELSARGVKFTMPPTKQPWGGYMSLMSDPEGNVFYLDQLREED